LKEESEIRVQANHTFDTNRRSITSSFHNAAQEHGYILDLAFGKCRVML
jgi:hypothetical protein